MKSSHCVPALAVVLTTAFAAPPPAEFDVARPGYRYSFPRDHFSHPRFKTEWWYYTGNLADERGRRFGFELTFFRQALRRDGATGVWETPDVYLAHFTVSDIDGQRFYQSERLNRPGPGLAGADLTQALVWNGNWQVQWTLDAARPGGFREQALQAVADGFSVRLTLDTDKPPAIHGNRGVSQKADGSGHASHYVSLTRLRARGALEIQGRRYAVSGLAWMDHEFFTNQLAADQAGWDWLSLQLDDGAELMLYRLRQKDGTPGRWSHGSYVDARGAVRALAAGDFRLTPGRTWTSPRGGARYPLEWRIEVPPLGLDLAVRTRLDTQEVHGASGVSPTYWEGAVEATGTRTGRGYVELTGYGQPLSW